MKLLSIDASTKSTGWSVFENNNLIDFGCLTASSTDLIKRIQKIITGIADLCDKYNIDTIVLEEVRPDIGGFGVGNQKTHKALMYLQAAIAFLLHDNYPKIKVEYLYPSEWRKACKIQTGRGIERKTLKQADIAFVQKTFNIEINQNDDIADAIGIGYAYLFNKDKLTKSFETNSKNSSHQIEIPSESAF